MRSIGKALCVTLLTFAAAGSPAMAADASPARCRIAVLGEMKVDFAHDRPTIEASIDGHPIHALADTGAQGTMISAAAARALHLPGEELPNVRLYGAGGNSTARSAVVGELKLGSYKGRDMRLLAGGEGRFDAEMFLGQDFWGQFDDEFDLSHGVIRLLSPDRACRDADMPYWGKPGQGYVVAPMVSGVDGRQRVVIVVKLNGKPVRAELDSGAQRSVATLRVADRIGLKERILVGESRGIGARNIESYVGRLDSFTIGDEAINNTRLLFADLFHGAGFAETGSILTHGTEDAPEMLLGADFLRAHHVLISQARHAVYITYEGGPVFDTRGPPAPPAQPQSADASGPGG